MLRENCESEWWNREYSEQRKLLVHVIDVGLCDLLGLIRSVWVGSRAQIAFCDQDSWMSFICARPDVILCGDLRFRSQHRSPTKEGARVQFFEILFQITLRLGRSNMN
jgi:hypothetical protein